RDSDVLSVFTALAQEDIKHLAHFGLALESLGDFQTDEKNIVGATFAVTTPLASGGTLFIASTRSSGAPSEKYAMGALFSVAEERGRPTMIALIITATTARLRLA